MYSQEIYIYFLWYSFTCTNLEIGPSAASLAWRMPDRSVFKILPSRWKSPMELIKCRFTFILKHTWRVGKVWQSRTVDWKTVGSFHGHRAHPNASKGIHSQPPNTHEPVFLKSSTQFVLLEAWAWDYHSATLPEEVGFWRRLSARPEPSTLLPAHSSPKVLVSSTAVKSFSYSMEKEGYGGRSRRLKQVWALQTEEIWCALVGGLRKTKAPLRALMCACVCGGARARAPARAHPQEYLSLSYSNVSATIFTVIFGKVKMF